MAGGMLTKQATFLTFKFLNDVNDTASGGVPVSLPAGVPLPQSSQTLPGDRIVLDDATALALSDTTIGTLLGGIYMYVQTDSTSTASPARGCACFFKQNQIGVSYLFTADGQPTAAVPSNYIGVFINAITKGNFGWVQIAGTMSVQFDSGGLSATALAGAPVYAKVSPTIPGAFDCGLSATIATTIVQIGFILGFAPILPVTNTISQVCPTRSPFVRV